MSAPRIMQVRHAFSMRYRVEVAIHARAARIWNLLTDARGFPRWNSTVTGIEGEIRYGERLRVHVPGSARTLTPTISTFVPNRQMIWTGGMAPIFKGVRVFDLTARADGATVFMMEETFSGMMIPLIRRTMPDFKPIFAQYASDLKREAERCP